MKPEAKFKSWLVKKIRELSYMVQTIETTTGRGVPDLVGFRLEVDQRDLEPSSKRI